MNVREEKYSRRKQHARIIQIDIPVYLLRAFRPRRVSYTSAQYGRPSHKQSHSNDRSYESLLGCST